MFGLWAHRGYLHIKHPDEVGALQVVFDEARHAGVLQAPHGRAVRQSHEELCHRGGHGLNTQTNSTSL